MYVVGGRGWQLACTAVTITTYYAFCVHWTAGPRTQVACGATRDVGSHAKPRFRSRVRNSLHRGRSATASTLTFTCATRRRLPKVLSGARDAADTFVRVSPLIVPLWEAMAVAVGFERSLEGMARFVLSASKCVRDGVWGAGVLLRGVLTHATSTPGVADGRAMRRVAMASILRRV